MNFWPRPSLPLRLRRYLNPPVGVTSGPPKNSVSSMQNWLTSSGAALAPFPCRFFSACSISLDRRFRSRSDPAGALRQPSRFIRVEQRENQADAQTTTDVQRHGHLLNVQAWPLTTQG